MCTNRLPIHIKDYTQTICQGAHTRIRHNDTGFEFLPGILTVQYDQAYLLILTPKVNSMVLGNIGNTTKLPFGLFEMYSLVA